MSRYLYRFTWLRKSAEPIALNVERWTFQLIRLMTSQRFTKLSTRWRYTLAAGIAIVVTALRYSLVPWGGTIVPYNAWIVGVAVTTILVGFGPGLLCALLGVAGVEVFVLQSLPTLFEATTIARISTTSFAGVVIAFMIHATRVAATQSQNNAERLKTFAAATFEGIVESEAGRIVGCNAQFARLTGYTMKELKGMVISDLIVAEDRDRVQAIIRLNLDTFVELVMQHKDGSRSTVEAHGRLLSPVTRSRYTVFRDTTARKRVEDALRESESRFRSIFENSLDAIFLTIPDGRVLSANPAACSIFGMSEEEIIRLGRSGLIDPNDPKLAAALEERKKTGRVDKIELDFIRKNGQRFPAELDSVILPGEPQPSIVILRDITERKRVIEELQLTRTSIDAAAEMFAQFTPDGKVRYVNDATCRMLGYSRNELLQMTALDFSPGFTWEQYSEHWREIREKKSLTLEVTHRRKDGSEYPAEVLVNHVLFSGQEYIFAYGRNITERKQTEEALRAKEAELLEAQRLAHIGSWHWDAQADISTGTDEMLRIYGFDPATQTVPSFKDQRGLWFLPEEWDRLNAAALESLRTGTGYDLEMQSLRNGQPIWTHTRSEAVFDSGGRIVGLRGTVQDITERKRAEAQILETTQRLQALMQAIPIGVALLDPQGGNVAANPAYEQVWMGPCPPVRSVDDYAAYQAWWAETGKPLQPEDWASARAVQHGEAVVGQLLRIRRFDGSDAIVLNSAAPIRDANDRITGSAVAIQDITAWQESERRLAVTVSGTRIGLFEWNVATGEVLWNPQHARLFGLDATSTTTTVSLPFAYNDWASRVHSEDFPRVEAEMRRCLAERVPLEADYRIVWPDGSLHWMATRAVIEQDVEGQPWRMVGIVMDITERKEAEEIIRASLAEKEILLKEIHHRVKNNLQVISSLISLQADALTDERILEELDDVRDRVRSMALVHEKLYQTSDLSKLNFAEYAASLAQAIWRSHSALARNVRLNLAVEPVSLSIETVIPCGLILNELLGNALKHAFPDNSGGEVEVGVKIDPATKVVCLRVRDNGVGLPAGLDWSQLKSLGLRLVKILASQVLGTVETTTDPGTEIKIIFPLKEDKQ